MDIISYDYADEAHKRVGVVETTLPNKADILAGKAISVPSGTTAERPILSAGEKGIWYNTELGGLESWNGTTWGNMTASITAVNLKGTDTVANILAMTDTVTEDLWIASDTLDGYVYDGNAWLNIGPLQGPQGEQGVQGIQGDAGNGISAIERTAGNGAPGTTDTYTAYADIAETIVLGTFNVYNGSDGVDGAGTVQSIVAGTNVSVDSTDPTNPIINVTAVGSEHYSQEATPTSPTLGATWYIPSTGYTYIRVNDEVSDLWIDIGSAGGGSSTVETFYIRTSPTTQTLPLNPSDKDVVRYTITNIDAITTFDGNGNTITIKDGVGDTMTAQSLITLTFTFDIDTWRIS